MSNKPYGREIRLQGVGSMWRRHIFAFVLLCLAVCLAYSNSLSGTWAMDDIVTNRPVGMKDISDVLGYRKIAYLTFLLNQHIAPFNPLSFRLFNILIHVANSLLVYALAFRTIILMAPHAGPLEHPGARKGGEDPGTGEKAFAVALLSGIVFALHPLNINAVAYIVQRMTALATMFVLLSLHCYISAARGKSSLRSLSLFVLCGLFLVIGIFSKESAVLGVPLILIYDYFFISRFSGREFSRKALISVGIGIIGIGTAAYFLNFKYAFGELGRFLLHPNTPLPWREWMSTDVYWTPVQHVLTEFRVVARYLGLVFLPLPRFLVFDWWGFPVSHGIAEPITTLVSVIGILGLLLFSLMAIRRVPFLCFGILWYLIAISLESFFSLGSDLYFEHRNYLATSGLFVGLIGQSVLFFSKRINEKSAWGTAIILCLVLVPLTYTRNSVWRDSVTLWGDTLEKSPGNVRAMMGMGNAYLMRSDVGSAEKSYLQALTISARDKRMTFLNESAYSLGMLYLFEGKMPQAKQLVERLNSLLESSKARILTGFYKALTGDPEGALKDYREVLGRTEGIDTVVTLVLMGDSYRGIGMWDEAITHYNRALSIDPGFSAAYYGIGAAHLSKRNLVLAEEYFDKALSLDENNALALSDKADILLVKRERLDEALRYALSAVSKSPFLYQPYLATANILIVLGRDGEAEGYYEKALEHGLPRYMVPLSKARSFYLKGDMGRMKYSLAELRNYKDLPGKVRDIIKDQAGQK